MKVQSAAEWTAHELLLLNEPMWQSMHCNVLGCCPHNWLMMTGVYAPRQSVLLNSKLDLQEMQLPYPAQGTMLTTERASECKLTRWDIQHTKACSNSSDMLSELFACSSCLCKVFRVKVPHHKPLALLWEPAPIARTSRRACSHKGRRWSEHQTALESLCVCDPCAANNLYSVQRTCVIQGSRCWRSKVLHT